MVGRGNDRHTSKTLYQGCIHYVLQQKPFKNETEAKRANGTKWGEIYLNLSNRNSRFCSKHFTQNGKSSVPNRFATDKTIFNRIGVMNTPQLPVTCIATVRDSGNILLHYIVSVIALTVTVIETLYQRLKLGREGHEI